MCLPEVVMAFWLRTLAYTSFWAIQVLGSFLQDWAMIWRICGPGTTRAFESSGRVGEGIWVSEAQGF